MKNFIGVDPHIKHSRYGVGVDVGGTNIIFVLLRDKKIARFKKIKTPKTRKDLIKVLLKNIKHWKDSFKIEGLGLGIPGILDVKKGKVLEAPNLKYLDNFPLAQVLRKKTGLKTVLENDANCFVLAEALLGAGKGKNIVFGLTLGSGIGGGLVVKTKNEKLKTKNYEIFRGAFGSAGEIGHMTIKFDGPKCPCGNFGCFEEYGGKRFFQKKKVSSKELAQKANKGDKKAKKIFQEYGKYLGIGIANIVNLLDPDIIIIGGGISKAQKHFLNQAKKEAKKRIVSPLSKKNLLLRPAKLGQVSGAAGAALLIKSL